jgi:hypothetical protein
MAQSEPKGTKARKPTGNLEGVKVAQGLEKEPTSKAEVTGHTAPYPGAWYICHCDGAANWVPGGWNYFYCYRDYCLNYV